MSGLLVTPGGTLVDRTLAFLSAGPADSLTITRDVLGISRATRAVAERVAAALLGSHPRIHRMPDGRWSVAGLDGGAQALSAVMFAIVDVETTGGRPSTGDRVTEIAIATLNNGQPELLLEHLVNPGRAIPPYVRALTQITDEMVSRAPPFEEIADAVAAALSGRIFVAHNARFDWAFVAHELRRTRDVVLEGPRICTVRLAKRLVPGLRHRGLDSVAMYFGVDIEGRHRAAGDALATARIFARLLERAREQGVETVEALTALGRPRGRRRKRRRRASPVPMDEA